MKPFDLEKALAGEPVVTRSGLSVTELKQFSTGDILGVVGGELHRFTTKGHFAKWDSSEHKWNLFMAPVKKQEWINIYRNGRSFFVGQTGFGNEQDAIALGRQSNYYATSVLVEWEE